MTSELRSRLATLVVLALLGVGLAVIGTAVGATDPLTTSEPGAAFVVSEGDVTFEHGDQQATVLDNTTTVDSIEIEQQGSGTYRVNTETDGPLTDSDRSQAKAIARDNTTIREALQDMDQYELAVEPIHKLTVDAVQTTSFTGLNTTSMDDASASGAGTFTLRVEDSDETGTVTIDRGPGYVEDEAAVRIRDPATGETYYSATVDLENETVTEVTEWETI